MSLDTDRNPLLQGGRSKVSIQSETTGKGKFDHNEIRSRKKKALTNRGQRNAYPNGGNEATLCVLPGELLIARRKMRNFHASRGEPTLSTFSSLNGLEWGRWPSVDAMRRSFIYVGRSKNKYLQPTQPRGLSQTESGLAWIETGKASTIHTGTRVIQAADLVEIQFPSTSRDASYELTPSGATYRSKSVLRGGEHLGKYLMMTEPLDPTSFGIQLMGAHALMGRSSKMMPSPGVKDIKFNDIYNGIIGQRNHQYFTDGQDCSAAILFGIAGNTCNMLDALQGEIGNFYANAQGNETLGKYMARKMGIFSDGTDASSRDLLMVGMDEVFKQNISKYHRRKAVLGAFKARNKNAFTDNGTRLLNNENEDVLYAKFTLDSLRFLLAGIGNAQYEKNRWIIGKAANSCAPGDTLDMIFGMYSRPLGN